MKTLDLIRCDDIRRRRHTMKVRAQQAWHDKHCPNCAEERVRQDLGEAMQRAMEEIQQQARDGLPNGTVVMLKPTTKH